MIRDFAQCHLLCRFFGCFLIQGFTPGSPRKARVTVKSSYTLYTTTCVSVVVLFEGGALAKRVAWSVSLGVEKHFDEALSSVMNISTMIEVATNVSCALLGSGWMLEFFQKSSDFRPPATRDVLRRCHWFFGLCVLAEGLGMYVTVAIFYNRPRTDGIYKRSRVVYCRLAASAAAAAYFFYGSIAYLALRSTCGALAWYVKAQREAYDTCRTEVAEGVSKNTELVGTSRPCRGTCPRSRINGVCSTKLFVSAPILLWLKCAAAHATFSNNSHAALLTCLIGHTIQCSARFFELAFVSQCLRDEAQKLKESVRATITCGVTDSYFKQMMVALITYAVILLQTSYQLMQNVFNLNATSSAKLAALTVIIQ